MGMIAALVEAGFDVEVEGAVGAERMLESGVKTVAESVPVGLTVLVGGTEVVSLSLVAVIRGAVVLAISGVRSGVVVGRSVGGDEMLIVLL